MLPPKQMLIATARWANENFLWLLLGSYAAAMVLPELGLWLARRSIGQATIVGEPTRFSLTMLLLACLLGNAGLEVPLGQLRHLLRRPGCLLAGLVGNLAIPVVFILCIAQVMRFWHSPDDMQSVLVGLALIAAMPIAGSATAWTLKSNGDLSLSLGLVIISTFLSLWTTPLTLYTVSLVATGDYATELNDLASRGTGVFLFLCVLGPTALGILLRLVLGEARVAHARPALKVFNAVNLLLLIYVNASTALPQTLAGPGLDLIAAMVGIAVSFCVVAFAGGWLVARVLRTERAEETSLMFGLGMNNNGTGLVLASVALAGQSQVMLTIICYNLVQHLVAGAVDFLRARQARLEEVSGGLTPQTSSAVLRPFLSFGMTRAAGVVLVSACASYWNVRTLEATNRWVVHTHEVLTELQGTLSLLKDAETGQRGFLLTGREHYLEPYHDAIAHIPGKLQRLKDLTADNSQQQSRFPDLEARVHVRPDELRRTIATRREQGLDAALSIVLADEGKREMDTIRQTIAEMETTEQRALEGRAAEADLRVGRTLATIVIASAIALLFHLRRGWATGRQKAVERAVQHPGRLDLGVGTAATDGAAKRVAGAALPAQAAAFR